MFPSPIISGLAVINWIGPAVSNSLSWIWLVEDLQLGLFLTNLVGQFLYRETDCGQVVGESVLYLLCRGLHYVDSGFYCVVDVHHRQAGFLLHETCVFPLKNAIVKNGNSVVGCPSSWLCFPTDYSWISHASNVQAIFFKVIGSQHLTSILCDSVHGCWLNRTMLRCTFLWSCWAKNSHWTGAKDFADFQFNCNIKDIFIRNEVHIPAKFRILFSSCWQNSGHMINLCDFVFQTNFFESLFISYITLL